MAVRSVISTLNTDGTEVMGPGILMYHYPGSDIMNGSLLTVESNHFCVLKSRGATAVEARLRKIREVVGDRQKYIEIS